MSITCIMISTVFWIVSCPILLHVYVSLLNWWCNGSFSASSEVTDLQAITQDSNSILIQWGLPEQPNGIIASYIIAVGNTHHTIQNGTFFYSLDAVPGETISFTINAEVAATSDIEGNMTSLTCTLNTTVPFPDSELIDTSISTFTVYLPPASLYPDNGDIVWASCFDCVWYSVHWLHMLTLTLYVYMCTIKCELWYALHLKEILVYRMLKVKLYY